MTENEKGKALLREAFLEISEEELRTAQEGENYILSPQTKLRMQKLLREKKYPRRNFFMELGKRTAVLALMILVSAFIIVNFMNQDAVVDLHRAQIGNYFYDYSMNENGGEIIVTLNAENVNVEDLEVKTLCIVQYATGEFETKESEGNFKIDGQSISSEVDFAYETEEAIVGICSEHHFYQNGEYLDTVIVDLMQGKDFS